MKITSFEHACQLNGCDPNEARFTTGAVDTIAYEKLKIIVFEANDKKEVDFNNADEWKYIPYFDMKISKNNPSGFCLLDVHYYFTLSVVGSRLCFLDEDTARDTVQTFIELYRYFFTK